MSTQIKKSEFSIMDEMDEQQITGFSEEMKKAMAYKTNKGKVELTFIGLKTIALKMSQKGQPLETIDYSVKLDKFDSTDKEEWIWFGEVKVRNQKTGLETVGMSQQYFLERGQDGKIKAMDQHGKTKAHSKAERNAWRKQIPELELTMFIKSLDKDSVKDVETKGTFQKSESDYCTCTVEKREVTIDKGGCRTCHKMLSPLVSEELRKKE